MDPPSASGTAPPPEIAVEGVPYDDENRTPPPNIFLNQTIAAFVGVEIVAAAGTEGIDSNRLVAIMVAWL